MTTFPFYLTDHDALIEVKCLLGEDELSLALDTGASHTVVDLTVLLIAGYDLKDAIGTIEFETAKGIVEAYIFKVEKFTALGITRDHIEICAYDYLANHVLTNIDGVLGLDFFKDKDLLISFKRFEIVIS
jgi:predicted aspartyl protease